MQHACCRRSGKRRVFMQSYFSGEDRSKGKEGWTDPESCIKVHGSRERDEGGIQAVGMPWGRSDKSSQAHDKQHPKAGFRRGRGLLCFRGGVLETLKNKNKHFVELGLTSTHLMDESMSLEISIHPSPLSSPHTYPSPPRGSSPLYYYYYYYYYYCCYCFVCDQST